MFHPLVPFGRSARCVLFLGLFLGLLLAPGRAATFNWTKLVSGNASGSWTNQSNWSGAALPTTTNDTANFATLDLTADSTVTLDGNQSLNALTFGDTTNTTAASWLLNAGTPAAATLTLGGTSPAISVYGLAGGEAAVINAVIAGTSGLTKSGTSYLQLNAANTYSGGTILSNSDCRVSLGHDRAFGVGKVMVGATVGAGQVWFQSAGNRTLTNTFEIRTIRWIIDWNSANGIAAGDLTVNAPVLWNPGSNGRDIFCGSDLTLNGPVSGSYGLGKQGGGTLTLNATNTYTGATVLYANTGPIIVNGRVNSTSAVTVNSSATLGGTGVVAGAVSVLDGGTLRPGTSGSGTFTCAGLSLSANAKITLAVGAPNNPANGLIRVNGNLTLDGSLSLADLGGVTAGVYTNFWYSGSLVNNGIVITGAPVGRTVVVDTKTPNYVLLRVLDGQLWPAAGEAVPMVLASPLALSWVQVVNAIAYDAFLGTSSNTVYAATTNSAGIYQGRTANLTNTIAGLLPNTTYFWRVDGVSSGGAVTKGTVVSFTTGNAMVDLMMDTWVATDALNRTLPGHAESGPPRSDRPIGIFYFLWHTTNGLGSDGPRDNTKEIERLGGYTDKNNPWADNPLWMSGANARSWYWGEPEVGYYGNDDEWVIRRHIAMLEAAGVDVLGFDSTNGSPWNHEPKYLKILAVIRKMQLEGTPVHLKIFHYTHGGVGGSPNTVSWLYDHFYKPGLYRDLWFLWQGKPLVIGYPNGLAGDGSTPVTSEVLNYFTWKTGWAYVSTTLSNEWQWIDTPTRQNFGYGARTDIPEQLPVTCGGWANGNLGRSYANKVQPGFDNFHLATSRTEGQGIQFSEQAFQGQKVDPQFLWIVGWNEWWAGAWDAGSACFTHLLTMCVNPPNRYFVDNYNAEYSRDIEPMKGGFTDNYYYQMVAYNRLRKGTRPLPVASAPQTINLAGDFSDWAGVGPEFRDLPGETLARNWPTTFGNLPNNTNTTGRNDFTLLKVARDASHVYFLAQCASNLTSYTGSNWMNLFLNVDRLRSTGWEGYDFAVNLGPRTAATTTLSRNLGTNWNWTTVRSDIAYKVTGNQLMLAIPRAALGLTNDPVTFDFHWADNFQTNDISGFFLYGDSAPERRFNYRYQTSISPTVTLRQDSFDSGKQAWWDESWTSGSKWNVTAAGSYSGSCAVGSTTNGMVQSALVARVDTSGLESLRVSFRYKLANVLDAQNLNVQFNTASGWVTMQDLGRDHYWPASQSWSYDERQNVWLLYTAAVAKSGTNAAFFHQNFAVRIDASGITNSSQVASIDDFLVTGVLAFTNNPPPAPWQTGDIGTTGISGDTAWTNGVFVVTGSGADIWNTADGFRFVWQPRTGDGYLTARVTSQTPSDIWAKAGVMIRETLDAGSRNGFMALTPSNGLSFQRRVSPSSSSESTTFAGSYVPPYWVRLVRSGTAFTGFASANGTNWAQIGATNISGFSSNAYWGLAVTAHNNARTSTATFDNVALNQAAKIAAVSNRTVTAGQTIVITNTATDPDVPSQMLTWSLVSAPAEAGFNVTNGVFSWRPKVSQAPSTNQIQLGITDSGTPTLSNLTSFLVMVTAPQTPQVSAASVPTGAITLTINGSMGPDYSIQASTNLAPPTTWMTLITTNPIALPLLWTDTRSGLPSRFYRILLGP